MLIASSLSFVCDSIFRHTLRCGFSVALTNFDSFASFAYGTVASVAYFEFDFVSSARLPFDELWPSVVLTLKTIFGECNKCQILASGLLHLLTRLIFICYVRQQLEHDKNRACELQPHEY